MVGGFFFPFFATSYFFFSRGQLLLSRLEAYSGLALTCCPLYNYVLPAAPQTSRCSAVPVRRLQLLREVACRSSKEKWAPHAGDQWVRGGTLWFLTSENSAASGRRLSSVLWDWRQFLWSLTEYKDTAHTLIFSQGRKTIMLRLRQHSSVFSGTSGQNFQNKRKMQLPQKSLVTCYITLHGTIIKRNNSFSKPSLITWCSIMLYGILNWVSLDFM